MRITPVQTVFNFFHTLVAGPTFSRAPFKTAKQQTVNSQATTNLPTTFTCEPLFSLSTTTFNIQPAFLSLTFKIPSITYQHLLPKIPKFYPIYLTPPQSVTMSDKKIMIPATAYVENAIGEPFQKRPALGDALKKVTSTEWNRFLGTLLRHTQEIVDDDTRDMQSFCDYYTLPGPSDKPVLEEKIPDLPELVDVVALNTGDAGKEKLAGWFEKMSTAAQRTPLYSINKEAGMVKEPKAEEMDAPLDETDVDALARAIEEAEKKKKKQKRIFGKSPAYGGLILTNGAFLVPYSEDTINTIGNSPSARFSTIVSFSAHEFLPGFIHIAVNICYGNANVQVAYIKIPMRNMINEPTTKAHETEKVAAYFDSLRIPHQVSSGAFVVHLALDSSNTTITFKEQAFRDLEALGMPYLQGLRRDIGRAFETKKINFTFLVPDGWTEFEPWIKNLCDLRDHALTDPLRPLKKKSAGQPITRRNYVEALPTGIPFAPPLTVFEDVDQFLTIQGDAIAREHKWQEWANEKLRDIECLASLIPIGSRKIVVDTHKGKKTKPLVYALTIHKSANPALLEQLLPPVGTHCTIEAQLDYAPMARPAENKTQEQIYMIIGREIHQLIWNHRRPPTPKPLRQQAWVDDYTNMVKPYIKEEIRKTNPALADKIAYKIGFALNKKRGNKEQNTKGESPREHKERTMETIRTFPGCLYLPPDSTAEIPSMQAVRHKFEDPISLAGSHQFLVKSPRYPNWPRSEAANAPVPFLNFKTQKLPARSSTAEIVEAARRLPDKKLIRCRITAVYNDDTARTMEQGVYKVKQYAHTPVVKWCTTFEGEPITSDVSQNFSVLKRAMYHLVYGPELPFYGYDPVSLEELKDTEFQYPVELTDDKGEVIEMTTRAFQERENLITAKFMSVCSDLTPDQFKAIEKLSQLPFGMLVEEGVPGSGKTRIALNVFAACLHSSLSTDIRPVVQVDEPFDFDDDYDTESDSDEDEDDVDAGVDFSLKPKLPELADRVVLEDRATAGTGTQALSDDKWLTYYAAIPLTMGPTKTQMETIISGSAKLDGRQVFDEIYKVYTQNYRQQKAKVTNGQSKTRARKMSQRLDRRHVKYYEQWVIEFCKAITTDDTEEGLEKPQAISAEDITVQEAMALQEAKFAEENPEPPIPLNHPTGLRGMVIANQNVNGDDLAQSILNYHNELEEKITIIRVTNLDRERETLIQSYRPQRPDYTEDLPSIADILGEGIDDSTVKDFADNMGQFKRRKFGGIFTLEAIMRSMLRRNQKPKLKRELERLSDPDVTLTKEEMKQLKKSIDEFIKQILDHAHVVVCTFHAAQVIHHKKLFSPQIVWIDEASRENEMLIRWAQLALAPFLLILSGDAEQDKPFCISNNVSVNHDDPVIASMANYFKGQYCTSFGARFKAACRKHMIFLSENFRQHGGLEILSSELFYDGEMKSGLSPEPTITTQKWYQWGQKLIQDSHVQRPPKSKDQAAEFLTYNRITYAMRSDRTTVGLSSVNLLQAGRAVDLAALVHQAGIPGKDDSRRPTICIITPYSAEVDEIRRAMRKLSDQEVCKELIEVRTQTAATGGEWDVVINVFVRDSTMGFLSDHFRLNVMWTRSRYLNIDVMDVDFFHNPKGKGSYVMRSYNDEAKRNGALIVDRRNWSLACGTCFEAHPKACKDTPKCYLCGGDHHTRKCASEKTLTPKIPEDRRFVLQAITVERPKNVTDLIILEDTNAEAEPPADEETPARQLEFEAEQEIQAFVSGLEAAPLQFEQPAPVETIQEDENSEDSEDEDNDDDVASDDGGEIMKVKLSKKTRQPVVQDAERPGWTGITASGTIANTETQDTQAQDTTTTDGTPSWANDTGSADATAPADTSAAPDASAAEGTENPSWMNNSGSAADQWGTGEDESKKWGTNSGGW